MKNILFITVVLADGKGDIGQLINFSRIIKEARPDINLYGWVICTKEQKRDVENIALGSENLIELHIQTAPSELRCYQQNNLSHYGLKGPGKVKAPSKMQTLIDEVDKILEYPVSYPYLSDIVGKSQNKTSRILDYGRSPKRFGRWVIRTGLTPSSKGILFHPNSVLNGKLETLNHQPFKKLLLNKLSPAKYRKSHFLTMAYIKSTPNDNNNRYLFNFIFFVIMSQANDTKNIDILCPGNIKTFGKGVEAILYEYGIKDIVIENETGTVFKKSIRLGDLPPQFQSVLRSKAKPKKRLRLLAGFVLSQPDFLTIYAEAVATASKKATIPYGICGDGTLSDALTFSNHHQDKFIFTFSKAAVSYHYDNLKAYLALNKKHIKNPHLAWVLKTMIHFDKATGKDVLTMCKYLNHPKIREDYRTLIKLIYEEKNFGHWALDKLIS